jgi:hypothetical protein
MLVLVQVVVVLVVGMESLQVVSLLDVLHLVLSSFEMERRNGPQSSFCGFHPPPAGEGWFPRSGYHGVVRGGSFDRCDGMVCANPTLEQMAWHWFYSFGTNPCVELFFHLRARF